MKILHTSDWHLGRSLYGRKRYDEFSEFLNWLSVTIEKESVDTVLISGDIFDTTTPSNRAQELYYRFLYRVSTSNCRHLVVIAGNHDSPSFLTAPRELLRAVDVHVIGAMTGNLEDEVIPILDFNNGILNFEKSAIICAVPYLRDKDVRTVEPGETIDDKNRKLVEGIKNHYAEVISLAEKKRDEIIQQSANKIAQANLPIVAMGHLFTAGGRTIDGDGVRELYAGSLAHVGEYVFPAAIDYLALGHLHVPQAVGKTEHIRYCGSPIPIGYGEAAQEKTVVLIEFSLGTTTIREVRVPSFQQLVRIVGSLDDIQARIEELKKENSRAWLEIEYTGNDIIGNLQDIVDEALADSTMEIRRIINKQVIERVINTIAEGETLDDLHEGDVFARCLEAFDVPDEDREELTISYKEVIKSLHEEDVNAQ